MPATTLKKWGNSAGILVPKTVLGDMKWELGDELSFCAKGNKLELKKVSKPKVSRARTSRKSVNLDKLFQDWDKEYELPSDLGDSSNVNDRDANNRGTNTREANWGSAVGDEI